MPAGKEPSWHAFAATDLPDIVERFAAEWDTLPALVPGRSECRILIGAGRVVAFYAVEAQLTSDGAVELVSVTVDVSGLPENEVRSASLVPLGTRVTQK